VTEGVGGAFRRVLVIGSGGAGKTTLARDIGNRLHLPVIHLDAHYWREGWVQTPKDEWEKIVAELTARDKWVMDGNYGGTMEMRLAACDAVVFLDLPRTLCLRRALWRWLRYAGQTRPDMAPGCPEQMSWEFVRWIWTYPIDRRPQIVKRLAELPAGTTAIVLRSRKEVSRFLGTLPSSRA
jgi:adenylate kinase family enzyme